MQRRADGSVPVDKMMDGIEPDQSDENEIDGNDVVEKPWHDQNEYPGNDGDERRDMSGGDDHGFSSGWGACDGTKRRAERNREDPAAEERARAGSVLADFGTLGTACTSCRGRANGSARSGQPDDRLREEPGMTKSAFDPRKIGHGARGGADFVEEL